MSPERDVDRAANRMTTENIDLVLVAVADGELLGIVSAFDLAPLRPARQSSRERK